MISEIKYVIPAEKIAEIIKETLSKPLIMKLFLGDDLLVEYIVAKDAEGDVFLHEVEEQ